jgi:hypothetical protein
LGAKLVPRRQSGASAAKNLNWQIPTFFQKLVCDSLLPPARHTRIALAVGIHRSCEATPTKARESSVSEKRPRRHQKAAEKISLRKRREKEKPKKTKQRQKLCLRLSPPVLASTAAVPSVRGCASRKKKGAAAATSRTRQQVREYTRVYVGSASSVGVPSSSTVTLISLFQFALLLTFSPPLPQRQPVLPLPTLSPQQRKRSRCTTSSRR